MDSFREAVLSQLQKVDYPSTLKKKPAAIVDQVAKSLQRVVAASMDDEVEVLLGSSKVGGLPHAPAGFRWPTIRKSPTFP